MVALASLDGSLGFVDGAELMARHAPDRPARQAVLHLNTTGNGYNDLSNLDAQPFALRQVVTFEGFRHSEFFPGQYLPLPPGEPGSAAAKSKLETVLRLVMRFFDAQLAALGRRARSLGLDSHVVREGLLEAASTTTEEPTGASITRLRAALFPRSHGSGRRAAS